MPSRLGRGTVSRQAAWVLPVTAKTVLLGLRGSWFGYEGRGL
ncbi:MAG TPA: hypothetical protein VF531_12660 [Bacillota bacterium]